MEFEDAIYTWFEIFWVNNQKSKFKFKKNCFNIMLSDSWKSAIKMASKDPQKNIAKKYKKTRNCPASLVISEALTINPTNFLRLLFNSQFFLSFYFYFGNKTPRGLKTWEN